jgi:hypothetical protein
MGVVVLTREATKRMTMNKSSILIVAGMLGFVLSATGQTVSGAIDDLQSYCATSRYSQIAYIKDWGFSPRSYSAAPFQNAVAAVSNHWQGAFSDWGYYATNSERRLLLANVVSFAGTNAFIGLWGKLLDMYEQQSDSVLLRFIDEIHAPATGPLEDYVFLNFDLPAISNCLLRTRAFHSPTNTEMRTYYDSVLSGEYRETIEDQRTLAP